MKIDTQESLRNQDLDSTEEKPVYTHKFRAEFEFTVPYCLSQNHSLTIEEEKDWVEARMTIALSEHLQSELGIARILHHVKTIKE